MAEGAHRIHPHKPSVEEIAHEVGRNHSQHTDRLRRGHDEEVGRHRDHRDHSRHHAQVGTHHQLEVEPRAEAGSGSCCDESSSRREEAANDDGSHHGEDYSLEVEVGHDDRSSRQ